MVKRQRGMFVRFDDHTLDRLRTEADDRDVSASWLVRRLVERGLDKLTTTTEAPR